MTLGQSLYEYFQPALRPRIRLEQKPRTVRLCDQDYANLRREISLQAEDGSYFEADIEIDTFNLNVCGEVNRVYSDSNGDGYTTPDEEIENLDIKVEFYECRDADGRLVDTDFNHKYL